MNAFTRFESLDRALSWLDGQAFVPEVELVGVAEAFGRVLADDVFAQWDQPPFARAVTDGYAVPGLETVGADAYSPLSFPLAERGRGAAGVAAPVTAGSPLPEGADAVVPLEFAEASGGAVRILEAVAPGANVQPKGSDIAAGGRLGSAGRTLRAQDLAVLAVCGVDRVSVVRRPRVRIVIASASLTATSAAYALHPPCEADSLLLQTLVAGDGGGLTDLAYTAGDRSALRAALLREGADLVLVAGGSGRGPNDHAASALAEAGTLALHGIALDPARSAGLGRAAGALVVLLPGEPAACRCAYDVLAARAVRRMGGRGIGFACPQRRVRLARKVSSTLGSSDYHRIRMTSQGAEPLASGADVHLSTLLAADGFLLIPEDCEGYPAGSEVTAFLYHPAAG